MRKRFNEANENDIIVNTIQELVTSYNDEGEEIPSYFNIDELTDTYGLSTKEAIDIAENSGYNVYKISIGDGVSDSYIVAHESLSYDDIYKDIKASVDIEDLGDETGESFSMSEDEIENELEEDVDLNYNKRITLEYPKLDVTYAISKPSSYYDSDYGWIPDEGEEGVDTISYSYDVKVRDAIEALGEIIGYLPEYRDMTWEDTYKLVEDNFDELFEKYEKELLEYFRKDAEEEASENYEHESPRESMKEGVDPTVRNALYAVPKYIQKYGRGPDWALELQARFHLQNDELKWILDKCLEKEYIDIDKKEEIIKYLKLDESKKDFKEELEAGDCVYHPERDEYFYLKKTNKPNTFELFTYSDSKGFEIASPRFIDKNSPFYNRLILAIKNANPYFKESLEEDVEKEIKIQNNENIIEDEKELDPPINLEYFPNNMGINLSSVKSEKWIEQDDGQLKKIEIEFDPATEEEKKEQGIEEDIEKQEYRGYKLVFHPGYNLWVNMKDYWKVYEPKGTLVGGMKTLEAAKKLVDKRIEGNEDHVQKFVKEDIEKHDTLNPKLFDGDELKPEVKETIQNIANEFVKELSEDDISFVLKDIVLLGSNVSYNYTKDSDLDIHLIADSSALNCPEALVDKLYGAYRSIFNKNYDITIKGIPAEIYVELDEPKAKSNGIYSLNNGWIKKPEQTSIPDLDEEAFESLFKIWEDDYFELFNRESTSQEVSEFIENLYDLRKESIQEEGEYGLGNLVFKEMRNLGYLDYLKDYRKLLKGKELSLESLDNSTNEEYNNVEDKNMDEKKILEQLMKEDYTDDVDWVEVVKDIAPNMYDEFCGEK